MKSIIFVLLSMLVGYSQTTNYDKISFTPISHGTFVIQIDTTIIYVDPVGGIEAFDGQKPPNIILITDIHGDHMNAETVSAIKKDYTKIIAPKAVVKKIKMGEVLNNDESKEVFGVLIKAIPMYNLTKERLKFHQKGRGNGYLLSAMNKIIYISGDTEDIPEMRKLENIDYAFVCMNLPYTMTVDQAASAILEMKPKYAFPYHHKGSDLDKLKGLIGVNEKIELVILKWY